MALTVSLFAASSGPVAHPSVDVTVPAPFKIIGGGAFDHWTGAGNLLTASYPQNSQTWSAAGKDHEISSPASITAFALAIEDAEDEWDVVIESATSNPDPHPQAVAVLPGGYTLTGGGAFVDYGSGPGNLLTGSFPNSPSSWQAQSKDHIDPDPASITSYVIGIRHRSGKKVRGHIQNSTGSMAPHPTAMVCLNPVWTLSGGGARDNWEGEGNLLTGSYPQQGSCWVANGKDHIDSSPATITAYVIGIRTF
jgi:hypothetical protein